MRLFFYHIFVCSYINTSCYIAFETSYINASAIFHYKIPLKFSLILQPAFLVLAQQCNNCFLHPQTIAICRVIQIHIKCLLVILAFFRYNFAAVGCCILIKFIFLWTAFVRKKTPVFCLGVFAVFFVKFGVFFLNLLIIRVSLL